MQGTLQVIPSLIFLFNTDTNTNMALVRNSEVELNQQQYNAGS
jgi:hypothetical protein